MGTFQQFVHIKIKGPDLKTLRYGIKLILHNLSSDCLGVEHGHVTTAVRRRDLVCHQLSAENFDIDAERGGLALGGIARSGGLLLGMGGRVRPPARAQNSSAQRLNRSHASHGRGGHNRTISVSKDACP